mgnify:FL=1
MAIKIFIDQGHNPTSPNTGAEGNGLREQDLVYTIGQELADRLRADPDFEVRLSRPTRDTLLGTTNATSLAARVSEANRWGADYFISLHTNAASSPSAGGSEAYVYARGTPAFGFAEDILTNLTNVTGLRDRGVQARPGLYVLRKTQMPATLVELGFITNPRDAALMRDEPGLFAEGIYRGIKEYVGA